MIKSGQAELLAFLRESPNEVDKIPDGWYTTRQLSEKAGISAGQTNRNLRAGVQKGIVEVRKFRILSGALLKQIPHYRMKK